MEKIPVYEAPDFLDYTPFRQFSMDYPNALMEIFLDAVPNNGQPTVLPFTSSLDNGIIKSVSVIAANNLDLANWQKDGRTYSLPTLAQLTPWTITIKDAKGQIILNEHPLTCLASAAARNDNKLLADFKMNCAKSYLSYRPGTVVPPALPMAIVLLFEFEKQ